MNNLLLVILLQIQPPLDTIPVSYLSDNLWNNGYMVTHEVRIAEGFIEYAPPTAWLNKEKQPISKPKKYFFKMEKY